MAAPSLPAVGLSKSCGPCASLLPATANSCCGAVRVQASAVRPSLNGSPSLLVQKKADRVRILTVRCTFLADSPAPPSPTRQDLERQRLLEFQLKTATDFHLSVADCMTGGHLITARKNTLVYEALECLVEHRITGMPVVDDENRVVGVVSDYDLLALDSISGRRLPDGSVAAEPSSGDLFPAPSSSWKAFREVQKLLHKAHGQTVGDVMTAHPLTVHPLTSIEDAAKVLLNSRVRRLPVVGEDGKLVGILTRGNVVRAALMLRRAAEGRGVVPPGGN